MTEDETWVHYYDPGNKAQSRQSVGPGSLRPKKFKTQPSAGRVMATVFWDAQGVIMLDFLAKKSTITGAYYKGESVSKQPNLLCPQLQRSWRGILLLGCSSVRPSFHPSVRPSVRHAF